ncbi:MAG: EamA family transporter [Halobacteriota archaeon]
MELVYIGGIALSGLTALLWAVHNVAIRLGTVRGSVTDAITVVMVTNLAVIGPIAILLHYPTFGLSPLAVAVFGAAGLSGLMLGRICLFRGIRAVGASRTTPVVSASALVSAVLAVRFLGETLTPRHGIGIVLIVAGIATISWLTAADAAEKPSLREAWTAMLLPLGAALFIGIEPIFVRIGLDSGTPVLVGLTIMTAAALVSHTAYHRLSGGRLYRPGRTADLRWYLVAALASTFGLTAYFLALQVAPVVVVIPIIQLSPLGVIAISAAFLPRELERVTWKLAAAATIVVVGAILVSLSG